MPAGKRTVDVRLVQDLGLYEIRSCSTRNYDPSDPTHVFTIFTCPAGDPDNHGIKRALVNLQILGWDLA
jgi:hypothetical protein